MGRCEKLLDTARNDPGSLRFTEVCYLAECFGFEFARQDGSHVMYKYPGYREVMNFQDVKGEAKKYQVKQLLRALEELGLID